MRGLVLQIGALLVGSAFLLFAGGINGLVLPLRGSAEGFSAVSLGLLGAGWAIGYVSGCLLAPSLVAKVGHIRAFGVMCAFAAIAVLGSLLLLTPAAWIPLRAVSGFCFAGAAMIVESWLSERAAPSSRGRIFGAYTMVNLVASTGGQMLLTLGEPTGHLYFVLAAMFYCFALVPTAVSSTTTPQPLVSVRIDIPALWRNSPVAVVAVFFVGASNGSFGTLAAVYGDRIGLDVASIALFTSLPILAGAAAQLPVGYLSDRIDRRKALVGVAALAIVADTMFLFATPETRLGTLALAAAFGASIYSMYPLIVAHANDHAAPNAYILTSAGILMVFGLGSIAGPPTAGAAMALFGERALFTVTLTAHVLIVVHALWRIRRRVAVTPAAKTDFILASPGRATTPETMAFATGDADDGGPEAAEG